MNIQCAACGYSFEAAASCPRCGRPMQAPLEPTERAARPGPAFLTVKETSQFVPAAAGAPAAGPTRRRAPLVIGIGVAALALVAGGAFAAVRVLTSAGGSLIPSIGGGTTQLTVTGQPPTTSGSWASGVRRVWRINGEHASGIEDETEVYQDAGEATDQAWTATDFVGDTTHVYSGLDPATGKLLWTGQMFRACAAEPVNGLVPCLDWVAGKEDDEWDAALVLVDWATGKIGTTRKLAALGITDELNPASGVAVRDGAIVLVLPEYRTQQAEILEGLTGVTVAKLSADARTVVWKTQVTGCDGCEQGATTITSTNLQHGVLTTTYGGAFDFSTGKSLFADTSFVVPVAEGVLDESTKSGKSPSTTSITAPDGTTMAVVSETGGWTLDGAQPPQPLRITLGEQGEESARAKVVAFDPSTGTTAWTTPLDLVVDTMPMNAGHLVYDGHHLLILNNDKLLAVDPGTGAVAWSQPLDGYWSLRIAADGTVLAYGYSSTTERFTTMTTGLDPDSGAVLWTLSGTATPVPNADGSESLLDVGGEDARGAFAARYDPADRPATMPTVPADAPSCPSGMTAISWTQYADGAILLCRADQSYAVVVPAHPDWQAARLTFTAGGYAVDFSNATSVRVGLGGNVVYTTTNGTVSAAPVAASWNNAVGTVKLTAPSDLPTCPAGSWPISLSVYDGGWLLVCGTAADAPSAMYYNDGSGAREAGSVTAKNGGYCGTADVGTVCGYRSPSVVSVTDASGRVTQHSAGSNYFDGHGSGGTGTGNGSYGVETPDDNAKDQVRYLTQILQKSAAGRTNLQTAVDQVRACSDLAGAVDAFTGVLANRQELIDALDSTPVDAVPDGANLVASLRTALSLSHDSDQVWLQWAQAEQANGCADGEDSPLYQQVRSMNHDVAAAKDAFLTAWNTSIAPAYGAPTFRTSQI